MNGEGLRSRAFNRRGRRLRRPAPLTFIRPCEASNRFRAQHENGKGGAAKQGRGHTKQFLHICSRPRAACDDAGNASPRRYADYNKPRRARRPRRAVPLASYLLHKSGSSLCVPAPRLSAIGAAGAATARRFTCDAIIMLGRLMPPLADQYESPAERKTLRRGFHIKYLSPCGQLYCVSSAVNHRRA